MKPHKQITEKWCTLNEYNCSTYGMKTFTQRIGITFQFITLVSSSCEVQQY